MTHVSLLIAQRNTSHQVATQLATVRDVLQRLGGPFELLVIDDASSPQQLPPLTEQLAAIPQMQSILSG